MERFVPIFKEICTSLKKGAQFFSQKTSEVLSEGVWEQNTGMKTATIMMLNQMKAKVDFKLFGKKSVAAMIKYLKQLENGPWGVFVPDTYNYLEVNRKYLSEFTRQRGNFTQSMNRHITKQMIRFRDGYKGSRCHMSQTNFKTVELGGSIGHLRVPISSFSYGTATPLHVARTCKWMSDVFTHMPKLEYSNASLNWIDHTLDNLPGSQTTFTPRDETGSVDILDVPYSMLANLETQKYQESFLREMLLY